MTSASIVSTDVVMNDEASLHSSKSNAMCVTEWVLVLGAASGIARALSRQMAQQGESLLLAGRNLDELNRLASDLQLRYGVRAEAVLFSALDCDSHSAFFEDCIRRTSGRLRGVMLCYGELQPQSATESSFENARHVIDVNFTSTVSILSLAAGYLEQRRSGFIGVISSVAGDRGRQSNYTYGAAKAGLSVFTQGLRNRLFKSGVHVLTVKPGFVATRMTEGLLNPKSPLVASPERVARDIIRALARRRPVLYTPWFWRPIMTLICAIPEFIFQRMKL